MLVVTTSKGMLHSIQGHALNSGLAIPVCIVLVEHTTKCRVLAHPEEGKLGPRKGKCATRLLPSLPRSRRQSDAWLAQLVEPGILNPRVVGLNPTLVARS